MNNLTYWHFYKSTLYTYTLKTESDDSKVSWFSDNEEISNNQTFQMTKRKSENSENETFEYILTANFKFPTVISAIVDGLKVECLSPFEHRILISYHEDSKMYYDEFAGYL